MKRFTDHSSEFDGGLLDIGEWTFDFLLFRIVWLNLRNCHELGSHFM